MTSVLRQFLLTLASSSQITQVAVDVHALTKQHENMRRDVENMAARSAVQSERSPLGRAVVA